MRGVLGLVLVSGVAAASPIPTQGADQGIFFATHHTGPFAYEIGCPTVANESYPIVLVATDADERATTYSVQETKRYEFDLRDAGFIAIAVERPRDGHSYVEALTAVLDEVGAHTGSFETDTRNCTPSGVVGAFGLGVGGVAVLELVRAREDAGKPLAGAFVVYAPREAAIRAVGEAPLKTPVRALTAAGRDPAVAQPILVDGGSACDFYAREDARCKDAGNDTPYAMIRYKVLHERGPIALRSMLLHDDAASVAVRAVASWPPTIAAAAPERAPPTERRTVLSLPFLVGVSVPSSGDAFIVLGGRPELIVAFPHEDSDGYTRNGPGFGAYGEFQWSNGAWLGGGGLSAIYYRRGASLGLSGGIYRRGAMAEETDASTGFVASAFVGFRYPTAIHLDFPVGVRVDVRRDQYATAVVLSAQIDVPAVLFTSVFLLLGQTTN